MTTRIAGQIGGLASLKNSGTVSISAKPVLVDIGADTNSVEEQVRRVAD